MSEFYAGTSTVYSGAEDGDGNDDKEAPKFGIPALSDALNELTLMKNCTLEQC